MTILNSDDTMYVDSKQALSYIISYYHINKTDKIHLAIFGSKRSNYHQSSRKHSFKEKSIDIWHVKFKYDELSLIFNVKLCFFRPGNSQIIPFCWETLKCLKLYTNPVCRGSINIFPNSHNQKYSVPCN